jgi:hypothetical protein
MTRSEVRNFIKRGVDALSMGVGFGSGRLSEFNKERSLLFPYAWLESLEVSPTILDNGLPFDTWSINLHIAKADKQDSGAEEYEAIIDECDVIAQKLIHKYNNEVSGYNLVTIDGYSRIPFIKAHSEILTGVLLSFTINSPDTMAVC